MNKYDNVLFLGDFNSETSENYLNDFCNVYKEPTCSNKPDNPLCIDFLLTNLPRSFQNLVAEETGISDFHKMERFLQGTKTKNHSIQKVRQF